MNIICKTNNFEEVYLLERYIFQCFLQSKLYADIKTAASIAGLAMTTEIVRNMPYSKKYSSCVDMSFVDQNNNYVSTKDEPLSTLMLYEPLSYIKRGNIIIISLSNDKEFANSCRNLAKDLCRYASQELGI